MDRGDLTASLAVRPMLLVKLTQISLSEASPGVQGRGIWIDSETGVGSARRVLWTGKTINEIMAFRHIGQRVIGIEANRAIGLAKYFGIALSVGGQLDGEILSLRLAV
jgi:hypothetical protein